MAAGALAGWLAADRAKGQRVRLLDVFALGPFMVYASRSARPAWAGALLAAAGAATVTYNGRNYLRGRR